MTKNISNYLDENRKTPHFYYQRSVILEQELKELKLELIKVQNENNRNKEILQNQVEKLISINRKQEALLLEFEQYRQICRAGVAIICRFCGYIIESGDVMQHLIDAHLFESMVNKTSSLESNQIFLKNQLENDEIYENVGSKCFELITQDATEVDKMDINVSKSGENNILIAITGFYDKKSEVLLCSLEALFNLSTQVI